MNYLAHLYLAEDSADSIIGNLLGDFVKGRLDDRYGEEIVRGITTHRKVDSFTDSHELILSSKRLVSAERRRFSGIIVDLGFDHFLARNWSEYSSVDLGVFTEKIYDLLKDNENLLPDGLKSVVPRMVEEDWLGSYKEVEGVGKALDRIARRFKRENKLGGAVEELVKNYKELEENFRAFFPQLISYVESYRKGYSVAQNLHRSHQG
jgi:acyl carrier protein phosphodiesterase